MLPPSSRIIGIDSSVFVRLLTGLPEKNFQETTEALERLILRDPTLILGVSNQVIGECYIVLQIHYRISKADSRSAILSTLMSSGIIPIGGQAIFDILAESTGAGLIDRLIVQDYLSGGATSVLTNDRKMAQLEGVQLFEDYA